MKVLTLGDLLLEIKPQYIKDIHIYCDAVPSGKKHWNQNKCWKLEERRR